MQKIFFLLCCILIISLNAHVEETVCFQVLRMNMYYGAKNDKYKIHYQYSNEKTNNTTKEKKVLTTDIEGWGILKSVIKEASKKKLNVCIMSSKLEKKMNGNKMEFFFAYYHPRDLSIVMWDDYIEAK